MDILKPNRRGLLLGLLGAPAIVQVSNLMPLSFWEEEEGMQAWTGLLTSQVIVNEFRRLFERNIKKIGLKVGLPAEYPGVTHQLHMDSYYNAQERTLSLKEYSDRILAPQAKDLAEGAKRKGFYVSSEPLEVPKAIFEGVQARGKAGVRMVSDYHIGLDQIVTRFDVRCG